MSKIITAEEMAAHYAPLLDLHGALKEVERLSAENERLREEMIRQGMHKTAPCVVCGYNGPGFYQPDQHDCVRIAAGNAK